MHPLKLEMDEAQDYPEPGWVELGETLKYGDDNATWRAHGVSRGVRDRYYKQSQPESGWYVHKITAMHRPDWTAQEREAKAELYGSRDHPDYRRNILGEHGDASSSLFVLTRLMACVDQAKNSAYNTDVYTHIRIGEEKLRDSGMPIADLLAFPESHKQYDRIWAGMDVGLCADETTEIFTRRGWLTLDEVRVGDYTLSIDETDGRSYWTRIDELHQFDDSGHGKPEWDMVAMRGQNFDALVTPRHRWLVRDHARNLRWKQTLELTTKDQIPLAVERGDLPVSSPYKDSFVKLAAWYFTEGTVNNKGSVSLSQSLSDNPEYVDMIDETLRDLYGEPGRVASGPHRERPGAPLWSRKTRIGLGLRPEAEQVYFYLSKPISEELKSVIVGPDKVPSMDFLSSLTHEQLCAFISICVLADGSVQNGRDVFYQCHPERSRAFETACALAGLASSTSERTRPYQAPTSTRTDGCTEWRTAILDRRTVAPVGAAAQAARSGRTNLSMTVAKERYEGRVWCPKLSRGNWLARRNGSVYFTGNTNHPSEILIFGEEYQNGKKAVADARLRCLARIHLERISSPDQRRVMEKVWDFYRPMAIAMDRTGLGLPIYQDIMEGSNQAFAKVLRGYNFSEKLVVGYEPVDEDEFDPDNPFGKPIMGNVLEYSSDMLRKLVDEGRLVLPWDVDMLREFQGQTYVIAKSNTDAYGKKQFNKGKFHALDGARMAVLAYFQERIEQLAELEIGEPVFDSFLL